MAASKQNCLNLGPATFWFYHFVIFCIRFVSFITSCSATQHPTARSCSWVTDLPLALQLRFLLLPSALSLASGGRSSWSIYIMGPRWSKYFYPFLSICSIYFQLVCCIYIVDHSCTVILNCTLFVLHIFRIASEVHWQMSPYRLCSFCQKFLLSGPQKMPGSKS